MAVYIVEANERIVAAIGAPSLAEAQTHARSMGFRMTLSTLQREGAPLWDGTGPVRVRDATSQEQARWDAGKGGAARDAQDQWITTRVPFGDNTNGGNAKTPWWAFWRRP